MRSPLVRAAAWCVVGLALSSAAAQAGVGLSAGTVVSGESWQAVVLDHTYTSMVVVCTPNYAKTDAACVVRVRNAAGSGFEFLVQRADASGAAVAGIAVHYVVVEEGVYTVAADGVKMEAVRYLSTVTDRSGSWSGEARSYLQSYSQPVVLGQVMTANDSDWSAFWCRGSSTGTPPNGTLRVGKHVGEDPATTRADEVVGYLVIEAGSGAISGRGYTAALGADIIRGPDDSPPYNYSLGGITTVAVAIATQAGMDGGNGGWAFLYGADPLSVTRLSLAIDEDQAKDAERSHTTEQVGYLVLEEPAGPPPPPLSIANVTIAEPGTAVERYGKIELEVTLADGGWTKPYDPEPASGGLDLKATFSGPGDPITVPGFYDGSAWRVRFAPGEAGAWSFTVSAEDASVAGPVTWTGGAFTCVDTGQHKGWPRIDGHIIRYTNGEAVFAVGHNNGWQWDVEQPSLAEMAIGGENVLSFWMAQPWAEMSWGAARAPIENAETGIGNYNQGACTTMDGIVARAEAAEVCLLPTIWSHDQLCDQLSWGAPSWWQNAYNTLCSASDFYLTGSTPQWRYQQNFYRYLIARWGYSRAIAGWVGVCEVDGTDGYRTTWGGGPQRVNDWITAVRGVFAGLDPFRTNGSGQYPIAFTKTDTWPSSTSDDWNDWTGALDLRAADSYRSSRDDIGVAKTIADETSADPGANMYASGKPCFHAEWGGDTTNGASQPTHLHNGLWAGTAAGAAMSPLVWCDGGGWPMLTDSEVGEAMRAQLQYLAQFMNAIEYLGDSSLAPATVGISGGCRGWGMKVSGPDRGYVWLQNPSGTIDGQTATVQGLAAGTYMVEWYDAWTSNLAPDSTSTVSVGGDGVLTATVPAVGRADVALKFYPSGPPNTPPVADNQAVTTDEDTAIDITLAATDADEDPLALSIVDGPANGTLSGAPPLVTYTPDPSFHGADSFTFKANDGIDDSNVATVSITVNPVNDAPVADPQTVPTDEDTSVPITLTGSDADEDPLAFLVTSGPSHGTLSGSNDLLTYTPDADYYGPDSFDFVANDGTEDSNPATVSINVGSVNDAPNAADDDYAISEDGTLSVPASGVLANDSDAEGDMLSAVLDVAPSSGTLELEPDGSFSYTPSLDFNGSDSFTYTAYDGVDPSNIATVTIDVAPVNDPPVASQQNVATDEDTAVVITLSGSDPDGDPIATYTVASQPANGMLSGTAPNLTYGPDANFHGEDSFTFTVSDGTLDSAPATVTISVASINDPPVASDQGVETDEDTSVAVTLVATDVESPTLTYVIVAQPAHGSLSGTAPDLTYTPDTDYHGPDSFTFKANDEEADSNVAAVTIDIAPVNDPPDAVDDQATTEEDASLDIPVLVNDTDPDGDTLAITFVGTPLSGTATDNGDGTIRYTPIDGYKGSDHFTYTIGDGHGGADTANVDITVTEVNEPPVASGQEVEADEDVPRVINLVAIDPDGDDLTYVIVTNPDHGTLSGPPPAVTYTPAANYHGPDSFTFKANDGLADSDIATVSIAVSPVNDAPVADGQAVGTNEDTGIAITLSGSDPDGDPIATYTVASQPANGTLSGTAPNLTYTPNPNWFGEDSFTFTVSDGSLTSAPAAVTIAIAPVNDPPEASDQAVETDEDAPVALTLVATDVESPMLTYVIAAQPTHGSLSGTAPDLTYTPDTNYHGSDSFTFKANDEQADSNIATVSIAVSPVNDAPVADDQGVGTNEDTGIVITLSGSDPDGDPIASYSVASQPANGTLSGTAPNLTYTPEPDFYGEDGFTFTVSDGTLTSAPAAVTITVASVNDLPVASDQAVETDEDTPVGVTLVAADVESPTLTYVIGAQPAHGSLSGTAPALTYTPEPDYHGPDSFTFKANDGEADSNVATVSITVAPVNDAPVATADAYNVDQDDTLNAAAPGILGNDSDVDGDGLSAVLATGPSNGELTLNANGSFNYTPNQGFSGTDSFTYRASDGAAESMAATVTISVNPSAPTAVIAIDMSVQAFWKWWRCTATVTVKDTSGAAVTGATVEGHWGGVYGGNVSGSTDSGGIESWRTGWISSSGTLTFTVDRVSKNGQDHILSGETTDQTSH